MSRLFATLALLALAACAAPPQPPTDARLERLEGDVAALKADMDTLLPPLARMAYADAEVKAAAKVVAARRAPPTRPPTRIVAPAPTPKKPAANPAPKAAAKPGTGVVGARIGAHTGTTRLVLDLDGPMAHEESLDKEEGVLLLTLPGAQTWAGAPANRDTPQGPHIAGYEATTGSGGVQVAIALKPGTKLLKTEALGPEKNRPHRLVFDFGGQ